MSSRPPSRPGSSKLPSPNLSSSDTTSTLLPVVGHREPEAIVAWRADGPVTLRRFIAEARRLAAELPRGTWLLNGCGSHYHFALGLVAALIRRQISVLPHSHHAQTLDHLAATHRGLVALVDRGPAPAGVPVLRLDADWSRSEAQISADPGTAQPVVPGFPEDQVAAILFTSGSTGNPVARPRRWGTIVQSARAEAERFGFDPHLRCAVLATVPAQHSYGFESAIWLPLISGGILADERPFFPADIFDTLARLPRPRMLVTSPVHLRAITGSTIAAPDCDWVMSATAPLPNALAADAATRLGARVVEIYGSTETGQLASREPLQSEVWETLPGVSLRQTPRGSHAEDPGTAPVTESFGGHAGDPSPLGDRIELLDAQHFRLLGRLGDLVNVGGRRGSVNAIEQALLSVPGVRDAAVLAQDESEDTRARLSAFVVAPDVDVATITRALRARVEAVFVPRPLHRVDHLPRDGNGKLPRARLLALAAALSNESATESATGSTTHSANPSSAEATALSGALRLQVPHDALVFEGHFPGTPILPGALLLDMIVAALLSVLRTSAAPVPTAVALPVALPVVKFLHPVTPGSTLSLRWRRSATAPLQMNFDCVDAADPERTVASGRLRWA